MPLGRNETELRGNLVAALPRLVQRQTEPLATQAVATDHLLPRQIECDADRRQKLGPRAAPIERVGALLHLLHPRIRMDFRKVALHLAARPRRRLRQGRLDRRIGRYRVGKLLAGFAGQTHHVGEFALEPAIIAGRFLVLAGGAEKLGHLRRRFAAPRAIGRVLQRHEQALPLEQCVGAGQLGEQLLAGFVGGRMKAEATQEPPQFLGLLGRQRLVQPRVTAASNCARTAPDVRW